MSGIELLVARARGPEPPKPLESDSEHSWAARGGPAVLLGDGVSAAAARRRSAQVSPYSQRAAHSATR